MIWGCSSGETFHCRVNIIEAYQAVISTLWENCGKALFYSNMTVSLCTRSIKTWLDEFGVEELDWLSLNPIKHL